MKAFFHLFFPGSGEELFDHIADCLRDFVVDRELQGEVLPLGFTFSFPCEQEGLAKARLVKWTKGFNCAGVEGEDVVRLLQEAIGRRSDIKIEVCAILNDTTGCLMSCAWRDERCRIGLILGTGTNACYLEEVKDIHTIDQVLIKKRKLFATYQLHAIKNVYLLYAAQSRHFLRILSGDRLLAITQLLRNHATFSRNHSYFLQFLLLLASREM
jgi:hexokinase